MKRKCGSCGKLLSITKLLWNFTESGEYLCAPCEQRAIATLERFITSRPDAEGADYEQWMEFYEEQIKLWDGVAGDGL